ncbi:MAG: low specificity L-threonine aldolase, partial [Clostridia bacterium]|nr:low specificity L-threonine aldolase [Clostridia bacterium]
EIGKHANAMAMRIKNAFLRRGYKLFIDSYTNQQFIILENNVLERLSKNVKFSFWEVVDSEHTVVRFAASFATRECDVEALESLLDEIKA